MSNRRAKRRPRRSTGTRPLHWLNLSLYVFALVITLVGLRALGSGAASCFFEVAGPQQAGADDAVQHDAPQHPPDPEACSESATAASTE